MSASRTVIAPKYQHLSAWISQVPELMRRKEGTELWEGRNSVRKFSIPEADIDVVVKRFKVPMFHQRVVYTWFRSSKARRAYEYSSRFNQLGISTPEAVAFMEFKQKGLFHTGYFISLAVEGIELRKPLEDGTGTQGMVIAAARVIKQMHDQGIVNGDLNLTNFLGRNIGNDRWEIDMVDLNRSHFLPRPLTQAERARNFCRLTHVRPLYEKIAAEYARQQSLPPSIFVSQALKALDQFER